MSLNNRFFIISYFAALIIPSTNSFKNKVNICSNYNGRRLYVDLGKNGIISGSSNSNETYSNYQNCRIELISCPACVISVKFSFWNVSNSCDDARSTTLDASCNCNYVWIYEPPYKYISGSKFCDGTSNFLEEFRSKTRTIIINFFYKQLFGHAFTLEYIAIRNTNLITYYENHESSDENRTQLITTPFFPHFYLADTNIEYELVCNNTSTCRVSLVFLDFLIAKESVIEVIDSDGRRLEVANGLTFRPAISISSGSSLTVRFYANGGANLGFKAEYTFSESEDVQDLSKFKTSCGGLVNNLGGGITMMNMVEKTGLQFYDCIWIIQPSRNYVHFYTNLQLQVVAFSNFGSDAELYIQEGSTSDGTMVEKLTGFNSITQSQHVTSISKGFYIRFRGAFQVESRLAIAYTAFSFLGCFPGTEFSCNNKKCIPIYLQCDGFDHCGDNSDEPSTCFGELKDRRWFHTLNFFFPKDHQYLKLHEVALVFVICCFGLMFLILALIILVFRVNKRVRQIRDIPDHVQVIANILEEETISIQEDVEEDEPPAYEAPPNYNEIEKLKSNSKSISQRRNNCPTYFQSQRSYCPKIKIEKCRRSSVFNEPSTSSIIYSTSPFDYVNFMCTSGLGSQQNDDPIVIRPAREASSSNAPITEEEDRSSVDTKHFISQDFETVKLKLLQKFRNHKAKFVKQEGKLSENQWVSDSNIVEESLNKEFGFENPKKRIGRSFSFEM